MGITKPPNNFDDLIISGNLTDDLVVGPNNFGTILVQGNCEGSIRVGTNNFGPITIQGQHEGKLACGANAFGPISIEGVAEGAEVRMGHNFGGSVTVHGDNSGSIILGKNRIGVVSVGGTNLGSVTENGAEVIPTAPYFFVKKSVGDGGVNEKSDVDRVLARFMELGFDWIDVNVSGKPTVEFVGAIRLFQAIVAGKAGDPSGRDGLIEPGKSTERWLQATNAPRWERLPDGGARFGFVFNAETDGNERYGSSWLISVLKNAGFQYLDSVGGVLENKVAMNLHELSMPRGGQTGHSVSHFTGLNCDVRLPRIVAEGSSGNIRHVGGITHSSTSYDRAVTRAMLQALNQTQITKRRFNDPILIGEGLCESLAGHDNHVHIKLKPPKIGPIVSLLSQRDAASDSVTKRIELAQVSLDRLMDFEPIAFSTGGSTLSEPSKKTLKQASTIIQQLPPTVTFEVGGHTDSTGSSSVNLTVSSARAKSVVDYLVNCGTPAQMLIHTGHGETKPLIRTETSASHRRQNRRITFKRTTDYSLAPRALSLRDLDFWAKAVPGVYRDSHLKYVVMPIKTRMSPFVRTAEELFTDTIAREAANHSVIINGNPYGLTLLGKADAILGGDPVSPSETIVEGMVVLNRKTIAGKSGTETERFFVALDMRARYSFDQGDPPPNSGSAVGGLGPMIVNGRAYGVGNKYLPNVPSGAPTTGSPGAAYLPYLVQRNNNTYKAFAGLPRSTGKTVLAVCEANAAMLIISQQHGVSGASLDELRDAFLSLAVENAVFFDGSDSAILQTDGVNHSVAGPDKNETNNVGIGFL